MSHSCKRLQSSSSRRGEQADIASKGLQLQGHLEALQQELQGSREAAGTMDAAAAMLEARLLHLHNHKAVVAAEVAKASARSHAAAESAGAAISGGYTEQEQLVLHCRHQRCSISMRCMLGLHTVMMTMAQGERESCAGWNSDSNVVKRIKSQRPAVYDQQAFE